MLCGLTRNTTACRSSSSSNNRRSAPAHPRLAVRFVVHHLYVSTPNSPLCSNSNSRSHSKLLINTFAVSTSSSPAQGSGGAVCDAHPADEEQGKQQLRKPQHAGSEAAAGDSSAAPTAAAAKAPRGAGRVLRALCHYEPTDLSDGPASLAKVRPYNAHEVQGALQHASNLGPSTFNLQQMSNIACALAAAGHLDDPFMQLLGDAAATRLKGAPRVTDHVQGLRALRILCWLSVGFARLGVLHAGLFEQVALYATHLLQRCPLKLSKRRHGQQLALLAAAFAALRLYPPGLYRALGEYIKQHRTVVKLLDPQDSMLLLWALARVRHRDPPTQLWLTQRAATQVGMLTCEGLARAYTQCASVGLNSAPLLSALRKASRVKLGSMQPSDLAAVLAALAVLGQQDLLYLDELARAVFNQLANFTAAEISSSLTALAALRYRNTWLLERVSRILVSRKLAKAHQLSPEQLSDVLRACHQLNYLNPMLLSHLGTVAAETQVLGYCPTQLAAVVQGYCLLRFHQPQLLQAAANRLLQLVVAGTAAAAVDSPNEGTGQHGHQQPQQEHEQQQQRRAEEEELPHLISAALQLASMPAAAGTSAERAVLPAALLGITAHTLRTLAAQHQHQGTDQVVAAGRSSSSRAGSWSVVTLADLLAVHTAILLCTATATPAAAAGVVSPVLQELSVLQPQVELQIQQQLAAAVAGVGSNTAAAAAAAAQQLARHAGLLHCMQLLWSNKHMSPQAGATAVADDGPTVWQLGLSAQVADAFVAQQCEQQVDSATRPLLQGVARALQSISPAGQSPQQVQLFYRLPDSPMVVPIALLPAAAAADGGGAAEEPDGDPQQQQQFLHVHMQLHRRKLKVPEEAQAFVEQQLLRSQRPVAVFVESQTAALAGGGDGGVGAQWPAWHTSNAPHQLLPAARLQLQGFQEAGWSVLVLLGEEQQEAAGE